MEFTDIEALENTIAVWSFVAEGKGSKLNAMVTLFPDVVIKFDCFLCEKCRPFNSYGDPNCKKCLVWGPLNKRCTDDGEAFGVYQDSEYQSPAYIAAAKEIVYLSQEALKRIHAKKDAKKAAKKNGEPPTI
jgi:hypothetical protein